MRARPLLIRDFGQAEAGCVRCAGAELEALAQEELALALARQTDAADKVV